MTTYGVQPSGFVRKPLADIKSEIEAAAQAAFGPGVIMTPQSPMGQLIGLFADAAATFWEIAEDVYQSYDPDQAEGRRLDILARLRLLERAGGELDDSFRQAITNAGRARIDVADIARAVTNIDGVTYSHVFVNDGDEIDANGQGGHSVAVAALGGDDETIATTVREYVVPGVNTYGNEIVETVIDGYCRSITIIRPEEIPLHVRIAVKLSTDRMGCPPPSFGSIASALAANLSGDKRPINGADVTLHMLRTAVECDFANVEVVSAEVSRDGETFAAVPHAIGFFEIAAFDAANVSVESAE